jgi:hypothetical protein
MELPPAYEAEIKRFLLFLDCDLGEPASIHNVPQERLLQITPGDICRFFNQKAFGVEQPGVDDFPTHARSNSLKASKKMLSKFMPRHAVPWDIVRLEGNPTRSTEVNDVIKRVMKCEVRQLGKPSQARRPLTFEEFINMQ